MLKLIQNIIDVVRNPPDPNWHIERQAKARRSHPLGGFWKINQDHDHGVAIGPANDGEYFISFCGPGGCFEKGTWRSNSSIVHDPEYRVIDNDTIEIKSKDGFIEYRRARSRVDA